MTLDCYFSTPSAVWSLPVESLRTRQRIPTDGTDLGPVFLIFVLRSTIQVNPSHSSGPVRGAQVINPPLPGMLVVWIISLGYLRGLQSPKTRPRCVARILAHISANLSPPPAWEFSSAYYATGSLSLCPSPYPEASRCASLGMRGRACPST